MASNMISRFLGAPGSESIYETLREYERRDSFDGDLEGGRLGRTGPDGDDERYYGYRTDQPGPSDPLNQDHTPELGNPEEAFLSTAAQRSRSRRQRFEPKASDQDDDVPPSLLVEGLPHQGDHEPLLHPRGSESQSQEEYQKLRNLPPPPTLEDRWATVQNQLAQENAYPEAPRPLRGLPGVINPQQRAMYKWANVEDLDSFLRQVYSYYLGKGIWTMTLDRLLALLTIAFVVGFSTFLIECIDYSKIPGSTKLSQVRVDRCMVNMSTTGTLIMWIFCFMWTLKFVQYARDLIPLWDMHQFYLYLLDIPDLDMQTISWQDVVSKLMDLRDSNPVTSLAATRQQQASKQRMDAHDIANRLMRKENYLIALFNKDILDLSIPLPFLRNQQLLTRTVEWNLYLCIIDLVFGETGKFNTLFLKDTSRKKLSQTLRTRFAFCAAMNIIMAPFIVMYLVVYFFFEYFHEFKANPAALGSRQYTPLAEWKFREFNELIHLFNRRMNLSYPFAARYLDQFPKEKTVLVAKFIGFIAGSFAAVLAIVTMFDPDIFFGFEITHDRTALFYIGVFTAIAAVMRNVAPAEADVFDPAAELSWVMYHTRYNPSEWKGRLHSDEVKKDFSKLYQTKVVVFAWEILSIILCPFVLWFSLPKSSEKIVDFFREFTVHVDGIGYVCSFGEFDFNMAGTKKVANSGSGRDEYYETKDNKMVSSIMGFLENYSGHRQPRGAGARYSGSNPTSHHGMMSPVLTAEPSSRRGRGTGVSHSQQFGMQSAYRGHSSTLLDRHHQPLGGHARTLRHSVYHPAGLNREDSSLREEDEEDPHGRYVSNLGDSFMSTRIEEDTLNNGPGNLDDLGGGGVIDLLRQFQRAHTDGHGRVGGGL